LIFFIVVRVNQLILGSIQCNETFLQGRTGKFRQLDQINAQDHETWNFIFDIPAQRRIAVIVSKEK